MRLRPILLTAGAAMLGAVADHARPDLLRPGLGADLRPVRLDRVHAVRDPGGVLAALRAQARPRRAGVQRGGVTTRGEAGRSPNVLHGGARAYPARAIGEPSSAWNSLIASVNVKAPASAARSVRTMRSSASISSRPYCTRTSCSSSANSSAGTPIRPARLCNQTTDSRSARPSPEFPDGLLLPRAVNIEQLCPAAQRTCPGRRHGRPLACPTQCACHPCLYAP